MYHVLLLIMIVFCFSCAANITKPNSNAPLHHTENGFTNPHIEEPDKNFYSFLRMRFFGDDEWADHKALANQVPVQTVDLERIMRAKESLQVTWLGHSSFLIQYQGKNILTDPVFSDRASPVSFAGPKRYIPHVIDYRKLPPIDAVVISHNHYDHLDFRAVELLASSSHFFVPFKLKQWFIDQGINTTQVTELDWWQTSQLNGISIQALPSQHWSARGTGDRFETLWASWSMRIGDKNLWFAGDTGYNPIQFKQIGERVLNIDLALIPIGGYAPRWFMEPYHVNPKEALKIHLDIGATRSIGMHWGTFPLTAEGPTEPIAELIKAKKEQNINEQAFITIAVGQTLVID